MVSRFVMQAAEEVKKREAIAARGLECEIVAPSHAEPGEMVRIQVKIRAWHGGFVIKKVELKVGMDCPLEYFGRGSAQYAEYGILRPRRFFDACESHLSRDYLGDGMSGQPASRITLAGEVELGASEEKEFAVTLRMLKSPFAPVGSLWKLMLIAHLPLQTPVSAVARIKSALFFNGNRLSHGGGRAPLWKKLGFTLLPFHEDRCPPPCRASQLDRKGASVSWVHFIKIREGFRGNGVLR